MKHTDKKNLHKVAESLLIQMIAARSEAKRSLKGKDRAKMLKRFEILKALGV